MDDHEAEAAHERPGTEAGSGDGRPPIDLLKLADRVQQLMRDDVRLDRARGALADAFRRT